MSGSCPLIPPKADIPQHCLDVRFGPIPGSLVIAAGVLFHGGWAVFAIITLRMEIASRRERKTLIAMG